MDFGDVHKRYIGSIKSSARTQHVPGLEYDDVVAEMLACLWKAFQTYKPSVTTFGTYWWSLWLNRRADITEAFYRLKRPQKVLLVKDWSAVEQVYEDPVPLLSPGRSRTEVAVWKMLAEGYEPRDVMERLGMTKRRYYQIIRGWRTKEVHQLLSR